MQQVPGAGVDNAVYGTYERGEAFVMEHQNDAGGGQIFGVLPVLTSINITQT